MTDNDDNKYLQTRDKFGNRISKAKVEAVIHKIVENDFALRTAREKYIEACKNITGYIECAKPRNKAFKAGWNAALAHAEAQHAEKVKALSDQLQHCIDAIETLPQDAFGVGGEGETHWYVRDELLERAKEVVRGETTE